VVWFETQIEGTTSTLDKATNDEESQLSERAMLAVRKSRCRKHPPRFLQDHVREASPIPMPDLPEDILFKHSYPVLRLQHRRAIFDEVAALSGEGMNKSAIARVKRIAWNTVHRWLARAAAWCRCFNNRKIDRLSVVELQPDEIKTIVGSKEEPIWIFAVIEVWSRLWPSSVVGKRSYQNTLSLFRNVSSRMTLEQMPLIVTARRPGVSRPS
jgi:hypothetical protein